MHSEWKKLVYQDDHPHVPLFVKWHFFPTGYEVSVTDLASIWTESLDRRGVIRRALNDNTTIDPSEDSKQLQMLLDKIKDALMASPGTALQLYRDKTSAINIRIAAQLPAPLEPLEWTMSLTVADKHATSEQVTLPALQSLACLRRENARLRAAIKAKEAVISRILTKMEASEIDLSFIFPTIARASGQSTSKQIRWLEQNVPGVAVYTTEPSLSGEEPEIGFSVADLEAEVGKSGNSLQRALEFIKEKGSWWEELLLADKLPSPRYLQAPVEDENNSFLETPASNRSFNMDGFDPISPLPAISSSPLLAPTPGDIPVPATTSLSLPKPATPLPALPKKTTNQVGFIGLKGNKPPDAASLELLVEPPATVVKKEEESSQVPESSTGLPLLGRNRKRETTPPPPDSLQQSPKKKRIGMVKSRAKSKLDESQVEGGQTVLPQPTQVPNIPQIKAHPERTVAAVEPPVDKAAKAKEALRKAYTAPDTKKKKRRF